LPRRTRAIRPVAWRQRGAEIRIFAENFRWLTNSRRSQSTKAQNIARLQIKLQAVRSGNGFKLAATRRLWSTATPPTS